MANLDWIVLCWLVAIINDLEREREGSKRTQLAQSTAALSNIVAAVRGLSAHAPIKQFMSASLNCEWRLDSL